MENGRNVRNTHENTKKHKESENDEKQSKTLVCKLDFIVVVIQCWEPRMGHPDKKGKETQKRMGGKGRKTTQNQIKKNRNKEQLRKKKEKKEECALRAHTYRAIHNLPTVVGHPCTVDVLPRPTGVRLMPRMASSQSANRCWCVVCVVVVTSSAFVVVLVRCSG